MISPEITDEFDEDEQSPAAASGKDSPLVVMRAAVTTETAWAIHARAEEIGKTQEELAGLLLACAVMLWKAGDDIPGRSQQIKGSLNANEQA